MKKYIVGTTILFFVLSCDKKTDQSFNINTTKSDSALKLNDSEPIESSTLQSCYLGISGKDSVFVILDDNLGTFIGKMHYKNFEKDSSSGDVIGTKNGDTIKLNYSFISEGVNSEREIYFLKKDGNLVEGIGEQVSERNKNLYANSSKINYEGLVLKPANCEDLEKKMIAK